MIKLSDSESDALLDFSNKLFNDIRSCPINYDYCPNACSYPNSCKNCAIYDFVVQSNNEEN